MTESRRIQSQELLLLLFMYIHVPVRREMHARAIGGLLAITVYTT